MPKHEPNGKMIILQPLIVELELPLNNLSNWLSSQKETSRNTLKQLRIYVI